MNRGITYFLIGVSSETDIPEEKLEEILKRDVYMDDIWDY